MRSSYERFLYVFAAWSMLAAGTTVPALDQVPAQRKPPSATLTGRVVDTAGTVLADAEVIVTLASDSTIIKRATSNKRGEVTIGDVAPGGPYTLLARKIGYGAAQGTDVYFNDRDTLRFEFELPALGITLPTITVRGRRGSRLVIAAEEFNPKQYPNALSVLAWKRPSMLGDPDRCSQPPSPPWTVPKPNDMGSQSGDTRRRPDGMGRRPWVNTSRFFDVFNPPYSPYVQRVYINGLRVDVPGQNPLRTLHEIPSDQITEIRYVDCSDRSGSDKSVPAKERATVWHGAIYITLKPPSREVQDSIICSIPGLQAWIRPSRPCERTVR
jgi:hypothetical protein